jgi:hypothetical protein
MDASLNKSTNAQFQDCIKTLLQSNLSDTQKKTFLTTLKKILVKYKISYSPFHLSFILV